MTTEETTATSDQINELVARLMTKTERTPFEVLLTASAAKIALCDKALAEWKVSFEDNPTIAFEWSHGAFEVTAERSVMLIIRNMVGQRLVDPNETRSHEELHQLVREYITDQAIRRSTRVPSSTSRAANLLEDHTRAMWASVAANFACPELWH